MSITDYTDRRSGLTRNVTVEANVDVASQPYTPPYNNTGNDDTTINKPIPIELSKRGDKVGVLIRWQFDGELSSLGLIAEVDMDIVNSQEQGVIYNNRKGASL